VKRRLLIAAIFLLAGAVVNVAVAWGCAVFIDPTGAPSEVGATQGLAGQLWFIHKHDRGSAVRIRALRVSGRLDEVDEIFLIGASLVPSWSNLSARLDQQRASEGGHTKPFERIADAYGWPILSMWCGFGWDHLHWPKVLMDPHWCAILVMPRPSPDKWRSLRALPLRPIWPGFAINTILYATFLWLLIPGPVLLRRFIRVKRGRCPACAYPVGESDVCSECGRLPSAR